MTETVAATTLRDPLRAVAGAPMRSAVRIEDATGEPAGAVLAALGWTARAQVRAHVSYSTVLHEWSTAGDDPAAHLVEAGLVLTATADETAGWQETWPVLTPVFDVLLRDPDGGEHLLVRGGRVELEPTITRPPR